MLSALQEENRRAINKRPAASATNYKGPGVISSQPAKNMTSGNLESLADREKKQSGNPFAAKGRPISQMLPSRPNEKSKTMVSQSAPKMTERQKYM